MFRSQCLPRSVLKFTEPLWATTFSLKTTYLPDHTNIPTSLLCVVRLELRPQTRATTVPPSSTISRHFIWHKPYNNQATRTYSNNDSSKRNCTWPFNSHLFFPFRSERQERSGQWPWLDCLTSLALLLRRPRTPNRRRSKTWILQMMQACCHVMRLSRSTRMEIYCFIRNQTLDSKGVLYSACAQRRSVVTRQSGKRCCSDPGRNQSRQTTANGRLSFQTIPPTNSRLCSTSYMAASIECRRLLILILSSSFSSSSTNTT